MLFMIVPGIVSMVAGVLFLCAPQRLIQERSARARSWIETDALFLQHRICSGLCLIVVGVFCLASAFYVWLRLNA